jgi:hypothetical protein
MKIRISLMAVLAIATTIGRSEVVHNTFGSNDSYVVFSPFASALGTGLTGLAAPFTPSNRVALTSLTVAMAHDAGSGPVRLTVRPDSGGVPSSNVLETIDVSGFASGTGSVQTVLSTVHPVLQPGVTYWIAAQLAAPGDIYQWHGAGIFAVGRAFDTGSGWSSDLESTHALRVEGTAISDLEWLVLLVQNSNLPANRKHPLLVTLRAAGRSFNRGQCKTAHNQLKAFQNKVRAQVVRLDAVLAADLTSVAQDIIDEPCAGHERGGRGNGHGPKK